MPRETFREVHIDRPLTNLSIAHFQSVTDFVSHRFFPVIPVLHQSDMFTFYPSGYFNKIHESKRAEEGIANSIGYRTTERAYSCGDDALRTFISDRKRANADSQRMLDTEAMILIVNSLLLSKEKWFVDAFMQPGLWSQNIAGVAAAPGANQILRWSDSASDPVADMLAIHKEGLRIGKRKYNKAIMTLDVYNVVRNHPDVMERIKYSHSAGNPAIATLNTLAQLFELEEILIMQTVLNTAPDGVEDPTTGLPPTTDIFMAENKILLGYVREGGGLMAPVAGATFVHNRYIPQGIQGGPAIRRYRDTPAKKGEYIEGEMSIDQRVTAPDLGCLITSVI